RWQLRVRLDCRTWRTVVAGLGVCASARHLRPPCRRDPGGSALPAGRPGRGAGARGVHPSGARQAGVARPPLPPPFATALLVPFAVRLILGVTITPRYFQATVPAVLVLLAVGATARGARSRLAQGAGVAVGVLLATGTALHLAQPGRGRAGVTPP